jgi:hypothetical protein
MKENGGDVAFDRMCSLADQIWPLAEAASELEATTMAGAGVLAAAALIQDDFECTPNTQALLVSLAGAPASTWKARDWGRLHQRAAPRHGGQSMDYQINASLLAALMKQWELRVSQALGDDLYFTDRLAWIRKRPDVAAGLGATNEAIPALANSR